MSKTFSVTREATLPASADRIYAHLIDLKAWQAWSPWEGLDDNMGREYSDDTVGPGARYKWDGNRKVGEGIMTITEVGEDAYVVIDLQFIRPFKAHNTTRITLTPAGDATKVTWTLTGPMTFMSRVMGIFFSMDKMVGKDFEKGLVQLEAAVKAGPPKV